MDEAGGAETTVEVERWNWQRKGRGKRSGRVQKINEGLQARGRRTGDRAIVNTPDWGVAGEKESEVRAREDVSFPSLSMTVESAGMR